MQKYYIFSFYALVVFSFLLYTAPLFSQMPVSTNIPYYIVSKNCGKALNVYSPNGDGTGCNNGTKLQIYSKTDNNASKWMFESAGNGSYYIVSYNCGKVVNVSSPQGDGSGCKNEGTVQLWDKSSCNCSQWNLEPTANGAFYLTSRNCGKVLNVYSPGGDGTGCKDETKVQLYDKTNANASMWLLVPASKVSANSFVMTAANTTGYWENTAEVLPITTKCNKGAIVFGLGQNGTNALNSVLRYDLQPYLGGITPPAPATNPLVTLPIDATKHYTTTDNQIVKDKNGDLIYMKHGGFYNKLTNTYSSQPYIYTLTGYQQGARGGIHFFKSSDCGKTWVYWSGIDAGVIDGGNAGYPRPGRWNGTKFEADVEVTQQGTLNGYKLWWVGDFDREEIYVCPFTGIIYVSTQFVRGPYTSGTTNTPFEAGSYIFYSTDNGKTWNVWKKFNENWVPKAMTSTPDGRLFVFYMIGTSNGEGQPYIRYSLAPMTSANVGLVNISQAYPVNYQKLEYNPNMQVVKVPYKADTLANVDRVHCYSSISRVSTTTQTAKVRVAYQYEAAGGRQGVAFVLVGVKTDNTPLIENIGLIEPEVPWQTSVMFGNFIEPDFLNMPNIRTNVSVFYWIEASVKGGRTSNIAKYCVFSGEKAMGTPEYLSMGGGEPNYSSLTPAVGDYMGGGFFWHNNQLNYFCQWMNGTRINANIVSIPYKP